MRARRLVRRVDNTTKQMVFPVWGTLEITWTIIRCIEELGGIDFKLKEDEELENKTWAVGYATSEAEAQALVIKLHEEYATLRADVRRKYSAHKRDKTLEGIVWGVSRDEHGNIMQQTPMPYLKLPSDPVMEPIPGFIVELMERGGLVYHVGEPMDKVLAQQATDWWKDLPNAAR